MSHIVLSNVIMTISGLSIGRVIFLKVNHPLAPSTLAASKTSFGRLLSPARRTDVENGNHCHIVIAQIVYNAPEGAHQLTLVRPIATNAWLTKPILYSRRKFHTIDKIRGATKRGKSIRPLTMF